LELGDWELLWVWGLVIGILPGVFVFLIRIRGEPIEEGFLSAIQTRRPANSRRNRLNSR
jgi:hypothetical protein